MTLFAVVFRFRRLFCLILIYIRYLSHDDSLTQIIPKISIQFKFYDLNKHKMNQKILKNCRF